ncbi:seed linoleate 9S-lipoxygenase-3 [Dorcoceras hygrometricum]|uniref:Seed linoleate 9S-lipoxygenase-3 n=1 Tax=Dorcoceras hygrometricum TaxID=472368 RepID=A0A2Z7BME6_9LAMI|nr:seed linoleate 9S-lipoxygenase-3 [Dorcoceras hygrometricum]
MEERLAEVPDTFDTLGWQEVKPLLRRSVQGGQEDSTFDEICILVEESSVLKQKKMFLEIPHPVVLPYIENLKCWRSSSTSTSADKDGQYLVHRGSHQLSYLGRTLSTGFVGGVVLAAVSWIYVLCACVQQVAYLISRDPCCVADIVRWLCMFAVVVAVLHMSYASCCLLSVLGFDPMSLWDLVVLLPVLFSGNPGFAPGRGFNPAGGAPGVVRVSQLCILFICTGITVGGMSRVMLSLL